MPEIILSLFAVIGITAIGVRLIDHASYRKRRFHGKLLLDMRGKNTDDRWDAIECAALTYRKPCGKAAMDEVLLLIESEAAEGEEEKLSRYLTYFDLPGRVLREGTSLLVPLQNTSVNEGESER